MKDYRRAKKKLDVSVGESVCLIRELQGLSQNELADLTALPQSTISAIDNIGYKLVLKEQKYSHGHSSVILPYWYLLAGTQIVKKRHNNTIKSFALFSATPLCGIPYGGREASRPATRDDTGGNGATNETRMEL